MGLKFDLEGRVALITGASRGIGRGIALCLAKRGANLIINDINLDNDTDSLIEDIKSLGGRATKIKADVSSSEEVNKLFHHINSEFGRLDILVNNAGISQGKDIFEISDCDWENMIRTNLTSGFLCSKAAMMLMREQGYGRIIFISSVVGQQGAMFGHVHYAASKSGQLGMVKTLARTGAPHRITVNAVAPGIIETELLHKIHGQEKIKLMAAGVPLGLGRPEDVGEAVAFLCSEGAGYITGTTLDVNGGMY